MALVLRDNTAEIWVLDLAGCHEEVQRASVLLSADERERAARFHFPADRDRFILARAGLRRILAGYHDVAPAAIAFEYSSYGKPSLRKPQSEIQFNTSHAADKALVACSRGMEIGVDIEDISRKLEPEDLARRFFSPQESEKLDALPADLRHLAFLRCWTCKEAYVKAVGKGLSLGLDQFDVSAVLANPAVVSSTRNEEFVLGDYFLCALAVDTIEGYLAAVIVRAGNRSLSVRIRRFREIDRAE